MEIPRDLVEEKCRLVDETAKLMERLSDIKVKKAVEWFEIRKKHKSDKAADKEWDSTPLGIEEMIIRDKIATHKMKVSVVNSKLRLQEFEARNMY